MTFPMMQSVLQTPFSSEIWLRHKASASSNQNLPLNPMDSPRAALLGDSRRGWVVVVVALRDGDGYSDRGGDSGGKGGGTEGAQTEGAAAGVPRGIGALASNAGAC